MREAMSQHRENPTCRVCHAAMDPIGFSRKLRRRREVAGYLCGCQVDASGLLPDGAAMEERGLVILDRPNDFVATVTEKLLTYALGRGIEYYDMPAVRSIVRQSEQEDYSWSSVIMGVVECTISNAENSIIL